MLRPYSNAATDCANLAAPVATTGFQMNTKLPLTRAFLSHSSKDKFFVQQVFADLGPTLAELDEVTFEPAKFNSEVILKAFDRCSVFVLFASENSIVKSDWVPKEIKEALARLRDNRLARIVVYCADKATFQILDPELKNLNIVRIEKTPLVCARQIRRCMRSQAPREAFSPLIRRVNYVNPDNRLNAL
jgi:TIR domain